jgi:TRAP-type uncharacterized transport system substrate-binding protein
MLVGSAGKALNWLGHKVVYSVGFGVIFVFLTGVTLLYISGAHRTGPRVVRIGYGSTSPVRKYFLEQLALQGKQQNLDIRLISTRDSAETLSLIEQNTVDLGLIAGAIEERKPRRVLEITPLYMEPLQLLVKADLFDAVSQDFGQLRGKSINLDTPNSATHLFATELMKFIGLTDATTNKSLYESVYLTQDQLLDAQRAKALPDAIFLAAGVPSPTIWDLIAHNNYRLVPLPFGGSFNLDKFRKTDGPADANEPLRLNKTFVEDSTIPAFVYGVLPAVPASDIRTISTRTIMVGSPNVDNQTVRKVLDLVFSPQVSNVVRPALSVELLNSSFQFDRHPGTDKYLDSQKPINFGGAFEVYGWFGQTWGIVVALYLAIGRGLRFLKERRSGVAQKSVGDFLRDVIDVEDAAHASRSDEERILLDQRLTEIKKASVELHLEGELEDSEAFPSLLVALADARTRIWGGTILR